MGNGLAAPNRGAVNLTSATCGRYVVGEETFTCQ